MITSGEIISLPFSVVECLPSASRIVSLYPDRRNVWKRKPRTHRMPPPNRGIKSIYGIDAGLQPESLKGRLIDLYV
jgi:hypothetical protein